MKRPNVDIASLLPHRPPMIMIDTIISPRLSSPQPAAPLPDNATDNPAQLTSRLTITEHNIFANNNQLTAAGLIENIAQTCAAYFGLRNEDGDSISTIGVIGALRNVKIYKLPAIGQTIETSITMLSEVFGMSIAEARTTLIADSSTTLIAEATLKIALL